MSDATTNSTAPVAGYEQLIACPQCDALYNARQPDDGARAVCVRCHTVLIAPRASSYIRIIALAITIMILMVGAVTFPFLSVNVAGFSNKASVIDAAFAFLGEGWDAALSVLVVGFIVAIPVLRAALVIYVLTPLVLGRPPWRGAKGAFRVAEDLRPWSMAEIFIIGTAVALTKVSDLARVDFGPAFWMFAALVVVITFKDGAMDRWSIWTTLDRRS